VSGLLHYLAGYVMDSFRERLATDELRAENVRRVRVAGEADDEVRALVTRMFPGAEIVTGPTDAVVIPMRGGAVGPRLQALLGRARHKLLVPSPHYVYRFGMRRGLPALLWAITDRLLLAPAALLWLGVIAGWMSLRGLMGAAKERPPGPPGQVLVIQLAPAPALVEALRQFRHLWAAARIVVLTASPEGAEALAAAADEVVSTAGLGAATVVRRVRRLAPEVTIVAGGADYGLGPTYLKAVALARLSRARERWQWELGGAPGEPLASAVKRMVGSALWRPRGDGRRGVRELLARPWRRRYYRRPPTHGPRVVQVAITEGCNYHCLMCAFHNPEVDGRHKESERPRLSLEMFRRLAAELRRSGVVTVGLTGYGEPLAHPQAMEVIASALGLGLQVVLTTNGSLITEARARQFVELGLNRLYVSLNAATDGTYARIHPGTPPGRLAEIVRRLRRMGEYAEETGRKRVFVQVSAVVTRLNMGEIPALVRVAREAGAAEVAFLPMSPVEGQPDLLPREEDRPAIQQWVREAKALGEELGVRVVAGEAEATRRTVYERIPCYTGYELCHVMADGEVHFCANCRSSLGNVHDGDFYTIWTSPAYEEARRAAMALPITRRPPRGCLCFTDCCDVAGNIEVHRRLYGSAAVRGMG
jgi:MoaA/NifB/PqqE/SkfB family radical SAM enzyme